MIKVYRIVNDSERPLRLNMWKRDNFEQIYELSKQVVLMRSYINDDDGFLTNLEKIAVMEQIDDDLALIHSLMAAMFPKRAVGDIFEIQGDDGRIAVTFKKGINTV